MTDEHTHQKSRAASACNLSGGVYFFAFLGAAIYFLQRSTTFWEGVLGFLKAIIWPAILIYKLFELLKM